jgi:hypothetical protein
MPPALASGLLPRACPLLQTAAASQQHSPTPAQHTVTKHAQNKAIIVKQAKPVAVLGFTQYRFVVWMLWISSDTQD